MLARRFLPLALVACLAAGAFKAHAADFTISTSVTSTNGGNTLADGDSLTINAGGDITITTANVDAINGNARLTIINNGSLTTTGDDSEGIQARARNTITHNGSITTEGARSQGIVVLENNTITLGPDSTITTSGDDSEGTSSRATTGRNEISNSGSITTSGTRSAGIEIVGNNEVTHTGKITTSGDSSAGIDAGNNNTLTLNGEITTRGGTTAGEGASHGVVTGTGTTLNTIGPNSDIKTTAADADGLRIGGLAASQTHPDPPGQDRCRGHGDPAALCADV